MQSRAAVSPREAPVSPQRVNDDSARIGSPDGGGDGRVDAELPGQQPPGCVRSREHRQERKPGVRCGGSQAADQAGHAGGDLGRRDPQVIVPSLNDDQAWMQGTELRPDDLAGYRPDPPGARRYVAAPGTPIVTARHWMSSARRIAQL